MTPQALALVDVDALDARLRAAAVPARAEGAQRYLKSTLEFYGTPVPAMRAVVREFRQGHRGLARDELVRSVGELWDEPAGAVVFERRLLAALLLQAYLPLLQESDVELLERFLREARTWALVDPLAVDIAGPLLHDMPGTAATAVLDRWADDRDFWLRRSALLAHERAIRTGADPGRFLRYADALLDERECFVRKAIGWVLRTLSRHDPDAVAGWLLPRAHRASGVTLREALKYCSPEQAAAVRAAASRHP